MSFAIYSVLEGTRKLAEVVLREDCYQPTKLGRWRLALQPLSTSPRTQGPEEDTLPSSHSSRCPPNKKVSVFIHEVALGSSRPTVAKRNHSCLDLSQVNPRVGVYIRRRTELSAARLECQLERTVPVVCQSASGDIWSSIRQRSQR